MKATKTIGILSIIAGLVMIIAGAITYGTVSSQLKAENITVPKDSEFMGGAFAGKPVTGPLSAYAQADIINHHALAGTDGKTYAQLGALASAAREEAKAAEDTGDATLAEQKTAEAEAFTAQRTTVMNASFLRASLFSSVIAFGVAALVMGLGLIIGLIGWALTTIRHAAE